VQNNLAQSGEAVSHHKQPMEEEDTNDPFVLVGIGHQILMLLKCILVLLCLVLVGIVYIVAKLT
jgi:hypothetical protein